MRAAFQQPLQLRGNWRRGATCSWGEYRRRVLKVSGDGEMVENKCVFTNKLLSLPNSTFSGLKVGLYGGCLMANRRMHRGASLQFGLDCRCHVKDYLNE